MKKLTVIVAGLGYRMLERRNSTHLAGLNFSPAKSVFPAVTCVAQASLRTGLPPKEHKMVSNGVWIDKLKKPMFWEQSSALIKGKRVWDNLRADGGKVGLFFLQQSLGENVDALVSPAPIHKHGGGMIMSSYTKPAGVESVLTDLYGRFPLWRYWGPFASPRVGRSCIDWFERTTDIAEIDEAYLYLPTLDYFAQKYGPDSSQDMAAFREFKKQLEYLADLCQKRACELKIVGDYEITKVTSQEVRPNEVLRQQKFFKTRSVKSMAYPDFYESTAFAMCDHEFCLVYGEKREEATKVLLSTGNYDFSEENQVDPNAILLLAKYGSWCDYSWWTNKKEAPDFAFHVDIHNKPGYDPRELFLFNRGIVKGTHGRSCLCAIS